MALARIAVMMAALTLAVAGWSSVIVDTFGPGSTFRPPPGEIIGGGVLRGDPPPNQGVTQAFEFTPVAPTFLGSVQLALQYVFVPGPATGPANLDVSIALDNAGTPGGALETVHLTNVLGGVAFAPGVVSASSGLNPLLQAGTPYWLVVAPPDLLNTAFDWLISPRTDLLVPAAERLGMSNWTTFNSAQPLTFRVTGTAEVPEPRSAILILGVLLVVALWEVRAYLRCDPTAYRGQLPVFVFPSRLRFTRALNKILSPQAHRKCAVPGVWLTTSTDSPMHSRAHYIDVRLRV